MPALYDKLGIKFQYPENWTLDEGEALDGELSVSVYSPGGAFWSVMVHPLSQVPQELVDTALQTMRQVYDELDAEAVEETIGDVELVGCDINFYCLDLTNTAVVRSGYTPRATLLIFWQADDRELSSVEHVFRAITISLLDQVD
ncbi:MAG TPA: hypothetical protein VHC22_27960 [Pirellulales bacterium]|nr:hypothetical protein [Pirellulales bacterium]